MGETHAHGEVGCMQIGAPSGEEEGTVSRPTVRLPREVPSAEGGVTEAP